MNTKASIVIAAMIIVSLQSGLAQTKTEDDPIICDYNTKVALQGTSKDLYARYLTNPIIEITDVPVGYEVSIVEQQYDVKPSAAESQEQAELKQPTTTYRQTMNKAVGDEIEYVVTIKDKAGKEAARFPISVRVYRRWKINVSTGAMFNIGLSDKEYYYKDAGNNQSTIQREKNKLGIIPSTVVLTHFYFSSKKLTTWGGVLGFGINDNGKTGWYLGLGTIIGRDQRLAFSGGVALRTVKDLRPRYKDLYDNATLIDNTNKIDLSDLTKDTYRMGAFIAVTYNITAKIEKVSQ